MGARSALDPVSSAVSAGLAYGMQSGHPSGGVADGLRFSNSDGAAPVQWVRRRLTSCLPISENAPRSSSGVELLMKT